MEVAGEKNKMSNGNLKLEPHHIDENHWWYEEADGITVLCDKIAAQSGTTMTFISWKAIRAALKRKDKKKK